MSKTNQEWIEYLNGALKDAENLSVLTRDSDLQREAVTKLGTLTQQCAELKALAIAAEDENFANVMLGFECVLDCLSSEIKMWIALKEERPDAAWDNLISAQTAASDAARAHHRFSHLTLHTERLENIENLVFPPQVFVSAGLIVRYQECSICGTEYGECDHLIGKPYWGKLCSVVVRDFEPNHLAIVEEPADKRCRVMQITVEGGKRNCMTWKIEQSVTESTDLEASEESKNLHLTATLTLPEG
jgi:hypothetical protein